MGKFWGRFGAAVCILMLAAWPLSSLTARAAGIRLRVAFKDDAPFYQFTDEQGSARGLHVDLIVAIARTNGIQIDYIPMGKLWDCLDALERGEVDVVLGVPTYTDGEFSASMETSTAKLYVLAAHSFLAGRNIDQISDYTAVFEYNTANSSMISNMNARSYLVTGSQKALLEAHLAGQGDVMICDKNCMSYLLRQKGIESEYAVVQSFIDTTGYVMAVKKGNATLLRLLNDGLMALRFSGEYDNIHKQWVVEEPATLPESIRQILWWAAMGVAAAALSVSVYILTTNRIRSFLTIQVKEKTTELDRRVRQLQNESELRNRLIEHSPNGMILFDCANNVTLMNASACRMVGLSGSPVGENIMNIRLFGDILRRHSESGFAGERPIGNETFSFSSGNGSPRIYHYSILPTLEGDVCSGALITVEDITAEEEKKQAIIEQEKSKALTRMMAGIAHEIRNPLTGIRNFAELIPKKRDDRQFLDCFAQLVPAEVDRISRLIESLMQYARPPKGNREPMDLSAVAQECAYLAKAAVKPGMIRVETELPKGILIEADRDQIKQVFINVIMNSIASMEKKLHNCSQSLPLLLRISTRLQGENAVVEIRDEGEGMSPTTIRYCTDPFFTSKSTGTGLGLSLSKQFVQENNGSLSIESKEEIETVITIQFRRYTPCVIGF